MFPHILNGRYSYYYLFFRLPGGLYQICCTLLSMSSKLFSKLKKKTNSILCKCCLWFQVVHSLQFMNSLRLFSGLRRDSPENLKPSQFSLFYTVCDFVPVSSMQWMLMICLQVGQWCLCVKALTVCCWFTFWLGWTCYAKGGHFSLFN